MMRVHGIVRSCSRASRKRPAAIGCATRVPYLAYRDSDAPTQTQSPAARGAEGRFLLKRTPLLECHDRMSCLGCRALASDCRFRPD